MNTPTVTKQNRVITAKPRKGEKKREEKELATAAHFVVPEIRPNTDECEDSKD